MVKEKFSLKDHLFNKEKVRHLAGLIKGVYTDFNDDDFTKDVLQEFPHLELKARIVHIREILKKYLPSDYKEALAILVNALPRELDPNKTDDDFGDFIYAPLSDFVAAYGCKKEHLDISFNALEEMTKRFSCEYAIRYFINAFEKESLLQMEKWSKNKNYHVRRLASEGSRPSLPWGAGIELDSSEIVAKILSNLYFDTTRFVVRSVANHLNDISKKDTELVMDTLEKWQEENGKSNNQTGKEMAYLIRHSLRTLIKKGDARAMNLLGYNTNHGVNVSKISSQKTEIKIGEALEFSFDITAKKDTNILIDYIVYFTSKNSGTDTKKKENKKQRSKVYRLKDMPLKKGETVTLAKKHPFRKNMTTLQLYPGEHRITLQINGVKSEEVSFMLRD